MEELRSAWIDERVAPMRGKMHTAKSYLFAWLAENGPDEWHRVANSWNRDDGDDILHWIIEQDRCDKATALTLFWGCTPSYFLKFRDCEDVAARSRTAVHGFDLMMKIWSRWSAGTYKTARVSTEQNRSFFWFAVEEQKIGAENLPFVVPDDMRRDIKGEKLDWSNHAHGAHFRREGIPY